MPYTVICDTFITTRLCWRGYMNPCSVQIQFYCNIEYYRYRPYTCGLSVVYSSVAFPRVDVSPVRSDEGSG